MFPPFAGGNNVQSLIVHDMEEQGNVLNLCLSVRRSGHPKPVAQGGWLQFVKRKELIIGDEVEFIGVIDANGEVTYKIRVSFRDFLSRFPKY
ncbi:hypothetical protein Pint_09607 [Pistacia integerrima]|uniref:Uncharacterized protein n=1 Tax=Pistacia integerrima TaxID=434235 RepID=A0ACC0XE90_9ROSI|nr:hypothetical protein Pint_09607 [Pistacia integerrima]